MSVADRAVEIVEVGLRDGLQGIGPIVPTPWKLAILKNLVAAGVRRAEIGSFVSAKAVPQMADTPALLASSQDYPGVAVQVLVPNARRGLQAAAAGARTLVFVLSASETHNQANVGRSVAQSIAEYGELSAALPPDVLMRIDLGTSFDCPFTGRMAADTIIATLEQLAAFRAEVEICLCDTTGGADPGQVRDLFAKARLALPKSVRWAFHGHDTYGLGSANVFSAYAEGVRVFDAAFGGLGGCPFAPGATGNVATEDIVRMFEAMGIPTGIDLPLLFAVAAAGAALPGASAGGRLLMLQGASRTKALRPIIASNPD